MTIGEWAQQEGLTGNEFLEQIIQTLGALAVMKLDERDDGSNTVEWSIGLKTGGNIIIKVIKDTPKITLTL